MPRRRGKEPYRPKVARELGAQDRQRIGATGSALDQFVSPKRRSRTYNHAALQCVHDVNWLDCSTCSKPVRR